MMFKKIALALSFSTLALGGAIAGGVALAHEGSGGPGGEGRKAEMIQKYDTNGDGKLDDAERAQMKADFQAKFEAKKQEVLAKYDANKDGKLDETERAQMKADKAAERFKKLDSNGDGVLSPDEFAAGFQGHGGFGHRHGHRG